MDQDMDGTCHVKEKSWQRVLEVETTYTLYVTKFCWSLCSLHAGSGLAGWG